METLFRRGFSREEMTKRVARFKDLHGSDGGLPDSNMPGCERTLFNVIGFQPPKGEGDAVTSPGLRSTLAGAHHHPGQAGEQEGARDRTQGAQGSRPVSFCLLVRKYCGSRELVSATNGPSRGDATEGPSLLCIGIGSQERRLVELGAYSSFGR